MEISPSYITYNVDLMLGGWLVGVCCYLVPLEFIHKEKQLKYIYYIHYTLYSVIYGSAICVTCMFWAERQSFFLIFIILHISPSYVTYNFHISLLHICYTTHRFSITFSKPINHFHIITLTLIKMKLIRKISKTEIQTLMKIYAF